MIVSKHTGIIPTKMSACLSIQTGRFLSHTYKLNDKSHLSALSWEWTCPNFLIWIIVVVHRKVWRNYAWLWTGLLFEGGLPLWPCFLRIFGVAVNSWASCFNLMKAGITDMQYHACLGYFLLNSHCNVGNIFYFHELNIGWDYMFLMTRMERIDLYFLPNYSCIVVHSIFWY